MTNLDIARARIDHCSKSGGDFLSLANLGLTTDEFKELIPEINGIRTLKKLDMSSNELDEVPDEIRVLHFLEEVNFSRNRITKLSGEIQSFGNLRVLNLAHNRLKKLPNGFEKIVYYDRHRVLLERLDLSNNDLKSIPHEISSFQQAKGKNVILDNNSRFLPVNRAFVSVANHLSGYLAINIAYDILTFQEHKQRLEAHRKGGVHVLEINNAISSVLNKELDLSGHNLTDEELAIIIPFIAEKHPDLEVLKLGSNNLSQLPDTIDLLPNLKEIDLSNNNLKTLPDTIGNLSLLSKLDISLNTIESLPKSMENLRRLRGINLKCNFNETLVACLQNDDLLSAPNEDGIYHPSDVLPRMREKGILSEVPNAKGLPGLDRLASPPIAQWNKIKPRRRRFGLERKKAPNKGLEL